MADFDFDDLSDAGCGGCIIYLIGIAIALYIAYVIICFAVFDFLWKGRSKSSGGEPQT